MLITESSGELDYTMLRQMCRRGRLMARLHDSSSHPTSPESITILSDILLQTASVKEDPDGTGLEIVPADVYEAILSYLNSQMPFLHRHAQAMPHPHNAHVLPCAAIPVCHIKHKGRDYSTVGMHSGNSSVHFLKARSSTVDSGHIEAMWQYTIDGILRTFIVLSVHQNLSPQDEVLDPYIAYPGFLAKVVYARQTDNLFLVILEQDQIVGHVAYYNRPAGTFGIRRSTSILVNSLHRYRT